MNLDLLTPEHIPGDLVAGYRGCRVGQLCTLLGLSRAEVIGGLVLLFHYTPHHVGLHVRNCDDGWAFEARAVCMVAFYADYSGDHNVYLLALEEAGYGRIVGDEFILFAPTARP